MTSLDIPAIEKRLQTERERLVAQMAELGATESGELRSDVEFGDGFADAGAATAERTELLGLVETLKHQLDGVGAAIHRIADGTYGTCAVCGEPIGADRLEARPESIRCVSCKSNS